MKELNFPTFEKYANAAMRTLSDKQPLKEWVIEKGLTNNMLHATLGLITELKEMKEAVNNNDVINLFEEFGDLLWFITLGFKEFDLIDEADKIMNNIDDYDIDDDIEPNDVLNMIKATMFYGKELDTSVIRQFMIQEFYGLLTIINLVSGLMDITYRELVDVIMTINISKLKKRYPDKYNDMDAIERDLNSERELIKDFLDKLKILQTTCVEDD